MLTEGRVRAIAAQVASAIAAKIKPSVSEEQIRSDVEAVLRAMKEAGELEGGTVTDEQIYAAVEKYLTEHPIESPEVEKAAESARKSAEDAEASVGEAQAAADEAGESASNAGRCATATAESASQAARSAEAAASSASAAQAAKDTAEQKATEAGESAAEAAASAEAAEAAKQAAEATRAQVEQKLANGDYKGKDGKDGQDGRDGTDGQDGYTPVPGVDYPTDAQIDAKIAAALAERNQLEPLVAESVEWLNENGDPTKVYIVPNTDGQGGKVYAYAEAVLEPDNVLAENPSLGARDINVGVVTGYRLSSDGSSGTSSTVNANALTTGFIPCDDNDILTVTGWRGYANLSTYLIAYDANKVKLANVTINIASNSNTIFSANNQWATYDNTTDTFVTKMLTSVMSTDTTTVTGIAYVRISAAVTVADTLEVYVNKGSTTVNAAAWYAFADFVPTADARIEELDRRLSVVESGAVGAVDMRTWDKPVYDTTPVVLIGDDTAPTKAKPAVGDRNTVQAVYDAYDALMATHPLYITRTPYKDKTADGQTLYRYDFKAPKPHEYSGGGNPAIVKPKIILISGIHYEWVGIWSLFHALEEIVTNPDLRDIRRNAHLIVVPVCNPYCLSGPASETNGRKNANGVEIHRNFAVDHAVIDPTSNNYGGAEPLSEVETRHIDSILAANPDAVAFISCHNFDGRNFSKPFGTSGGGSDYGTTFMWASTATNYLYNLGGRFGVKMSEAWEDKYGDAWRDQIDAIVAARKQYNKDNEDTEGFEPLTYQPEGDYTVGTAGKSTTPGTEAKHCMLYGIQGMTFEVAGNMMALDSENADSITITRGAEVYANLIATLLAVHDPADKKLCKYID